MKSLAVIIFADKGVQPYFKYTHPLFKKWCDTMKYDLMVFNNNPEPSVHPTWIKIFYILKILKERPEYPFVHFIDADVIINKMDFNPLKYLKDGKDVFICQEAIYADGSPFLNSGSMVVRNTQRAISFFEHVWSQRFGIYSHKFFHEQQIISELNRDTSYSEIIEILDIRSINSYWLDDLTTNPDNNVFHFLGRPLQKKVEFVKKYLKDKNMRI